MRLIYLFPIYLLSSSFVLITNYGFLDPERPVHFESEYRQVGKAKFRTHPVQGSHERYTDAQANVYYSHFLNKDNALSWKAGYSFIGFNWAKNPRFRGNDYNFANASVSWISTSMKNWRWIVGGATSVDASTVDFGHSGVYYGVLWGRYQYSKTLGMHIGGYGYGGVKNGYLLPIIGFDWRPECKWKFNAIFPVNLSIDYTLADNWSLYAEASAFGRPYRFPIRAHEGIGNYHGAIFEIYSTGVDLNLKYCLPRRLTFIVGGGGNFGGWILIKNHNNEHGKYYKFNGAPYGQGKFSYTF